jgi:hypothetical protein
MLRSKLLIAAVALVTVLTTLGTVCAATTRPDPWPGWTRVSIFVRNGVTGPGIPNADVSILNETDVESPPTQKTNENGYAIFWVNRDNDRYRTYAAWRIWTPKGMKILWSDTKYFNASGPNAGATLIITIQNN